MTHACCQSYIFKTFVLCFHGSLHLDDPYFLRHIYGHLCNTGRHNLKFSHFESFAFFFLSVLLVRECSVLVYSSTPLVDSRVEQVSSVDSEPNPS